MVSTRQMSSVGSGNGGSDGAGPSHAEPVAVSRVTRHSSALMPGGSSPHASTSKCTSILPAPKTYSTNLLDMPVEVIEKIICYLGFKSVSHLRMVNILVYNCSFNYHGLIISYFCTNSTRSHLRLLSIYYFVLFSYITFIIELIVLSSGSYIKIPILLILVASWVMFFNEWYIINSNVKWIRSVPAFFK